jgi:sulfite reductase (NADPH) flavoprotein alpha-component
MLVDADCGKPLFPSAFMSFRYFGYGSNMDATSLRAKGVQPSSSTPALLAGWRLRFNVEHFFRHEGGVGNIERSTEAGVRVWGVLHDCVDEDLAALDQSELYPHGYDRIEVAVLPRGGQSPVAALAYVGTPRFVNDACLPTRRYLNILVKGARAEGLDDEYVRWLAAQPVLVNPPPPPFVPPAGDWPVLRAAELAQHPRLTGLDGHVFDMSQARWQHRLLWPWFGGKDMTLFHLRRMDSSDGRESADDVRLGRYTAAQRRCLDEYLAAYAAEYRYAGRCDYG